MRASSTGEAEAYAEAIAVLPHDCAAGLNGAARKLDPAALAHGRCRFDQSTATRDVVKASAMLSLPSADQHRQGNRYARRRPLVRTCATRRRQLINHFIHPHQLVAGGLGCQRYHRIKERG